jgi:hypothetical protein
MVMVSGDKCTNEDDSSGDSRYEDEHRGALTV